LCGYDPVNSCGDTCVSNCNATAECGKWAATKGAECPLNVCCSQFGFCGTTSDFCDDKCQNNCFNANEPSCSSNDVLKRVIGYYESWSSSRTCDSWRPGDLPASSLTHVNYAFALFQPWGGDWEVYLPDDQTNDLTALVQEFVDLKLDNPSLKCYLSVGGWSFNDGDSAKYWSTMSSTAAGRKSFAKSLYNTLLKYGFDGADLDWEYPVASERGGSADDKENYALLIKEIRTVFDASGSSFGLTFTIPSSYWYLRHFDVAKYLENGADWANMMTYDLHGVWDGTDPYIGKIVGAHTNLTEIAEGMDLLWRNNIDPSKVVLGIGFYGRSFELDVDTCTDPGCPFVGGGENGTCTQTSGILSYKEIMGIIESVDADPIWNEEAAVMYVTWNEIQWVSYDNGHTFQQKISWANDHCLGGIMIWALDQDTYDWQAMSALLNKTVDGSALLEGGSESSDDATALTHAYNAYTGADCYITGCQDYNKGQCKSGYSVLDYVHKGSYGVITDPDDHLCTTGTTTEYEDTDAQYRLICCPTDAMPSCTWAGGATDGLCTGGTDGICGDDFELVRDHYVDRTGSTACTLNSRSLCCSSSTTLGDKCSWTDCKQGCSNDQYAFTNESYYAGPNLNENSEMCDFEVSTFCCPSKDTLKNCDWYGCNDSCPSDKVLITQRSNLVIRALSSEEDFDCDSGMQKLCCDPPAATSDAPVDPKDLFEYPDENNFSYYYNPEATANDEAGNDAEEDPFAFVMIDGDTDAYDESLVDQWTFLDDDDSTILKRNVRKRNIFEARSDTFDNEVEKYRIKCSSLLQDSSGCQTIFSGGASNTIVKMPLYRGAGPYARVISLVPEGSTTGLNSRSSDDVYELTVDYDLAAASEEEKGDVNFRIDYTNLLEYWDDVTDKSPDKRKRWFGSFSAWLKKVTTIVKEDSGTLPLEYEQSHKLLHWENNCGGVDKTLDLDAYFHLGLDAQYAYYFEGAILPTPKLIAAYGYFSVEPEAEVLLTLRGEASFQSTSGEIEIISGITFPGMSIKGLISIGPALDLTGSMDTSLTVSGELNAGVVVSWPKAEVYFPQDSDGEAASITPGKLSDTDGDDEPDTFSVTPRLDASVSASGTLALGLTPKVKFGISVLGGNLMDGYVTAGVSNTVSLGVSATASTGLQGSAAEFCYWADYIYSLFLQADVSFVDGLAYWGSKYDVASPTDPITLIDKTCISYSSDDDTVSKRSDTSDRLVKEIDSDKGLFDAYFRCCNNETDVLKGYCDSTPDSTKRASTTCHEPPALFYNCAFFLDTKIGNENEETNKKTPSVSFIGICKNIKNYLQAHSMDANTGANWKLLTYINGGQSANRGDACGQKTKECSDEKMSMWPQAVQKAAKTSYKAAQAMDGYVESISCDEFPFNACEEGGTGAEVACVPDAQQGYQASINGLLSRIYDNIEKKSWKDIDTSGTNNHRKYTFSLMNYWTDRNSIPPYGGSLDSSASKNPSQNSGTGLLFVLGGVNLNGNPNLQWGPKSSGSQNNAFCAYAGKKSSKGSAPISNQPDAMGVYKYVQAKNKKTIYLQTTACRVTFTAAQTIAQRGLDPRNADNWEIQSVTIDEDGEDLGGYYYDAEKIKQHDDSWEEVEDKKGSYSIRRLRHLQQHQHGRHAN
ncbi:CAZyme family GH18, partial [Penicillium longicatenatum]|uniref:CAZyme family GH18 n=1 Tax=Penicillium longicatenatum TaxID=1561947 RepID=UPI0025486CFD